MRSEAALAPVLSFETTQQRLSAGPQQPSAVTAGAAAAAGSADKSVMSLRGVVKAFGSTLANGGIDLTVGHGEILGLVGGNGAGKSTLMNVLCGLVSPDEGTLEIEGVPVSFNGYGAREAQARGIRLVHQELSLCTNLSVAENFFVEAPDAAGVSPRWREPYRRRARVTLDAVFPDNGIDVDCRVERLPIAERQMVEIARAIATPGAKLVVLDEPTSSLGPERSRQLRAYIRARTESGLSFIFISHKLNEIVEVASRVVVLRNGKLAWTGEVGASSIGGLVQLIGGEAQIPLAEAHLSAPAPPGDVLVEIGGAATAALGHNVELRRGEIIGLAGLEGSGQRGLLHGIFAPSSYDGAAIERHGEASFVSGDRQREGVFPLWSALLNVAIGSVATRAPLRVVSEPVEYEEVRRPVERLRLVPDSLGRNILELSGGNQQKALVARALVTDAVIILLDDPTRGVDVAAKRDFYAVVAEIARAGRLIIWHSTEDAEFLECDRVLVFADGRIVRELPRETVTGQAIVDASFARATGAADHDVGRTSQRRTDWAGLIESAAPGLIVIAVFASMAAANPAVLSSFGLDLLLLPAIPLVLVALAQMFIIGGSEIDLGAGAFAGAINVLSATLLVESPALGVLALVGALLACGLMGAIIQLRRIPAIVVTLGASFVWMGVGYTLQPTPGGASPAWLSALFEWQIAGAPSSVILIVLAAAIATAIDRSPLGVALRGFGNNSVAMRRAGWSTVRYAAARYVLAGAFALLAGLSLTAINTASDINAGSPYTLLSVAAAVMGGCSLTGGLIAPFGVVAGAVTLSLIGALLGMLNVSTDYNAAVQGVLLLALLAARTALGRRGPAE
jgi:ribose transport system ATP-binding protein